MSTEGGGVVVEKWVDREAVILFFLACVTIQTNFLKCFAVRAVGNALQPQISVINVVSNLIE